MLVSDNSALSDNLYNVQACGKDSKEKELLVLYIRGNGGVGEVEKRTDISYISITYNSLNFWKQQ